MGRLRQVALVAKAACLVALLVGCSAEFNPSPVTATPPTLSPAAVESTEATATARASAEPVIIVGHATPYYPDFAGWVAQWDGVAIVEITSVGNEQWNTVDGERPADDDLAAGLSGESGVDFVIGRPIEFRVLEVVRGSLLQVGDADTYWLPGGNVGRDTMDTHVHFEAEQVRPGDRALAFTFGEPVDFGGSGVETSTGFLFLIDEDGTVVTLSPGELIKVDDLTSYLP